MLLVRSTTLQLRKHQNLERHILSIAQSNKITLVDRIIPRSFVGDVVLVLAGVLLTTLSAQVQIATSPVPFTFQTFAVLVIGATYGASRGAITMGSYAIVGLLGLPVFADWSAGPQVIFGATGGFIIGFIFAAALTGRLAELNWSSHYSKMFASFALGSVVIYSLGIPVLAMTAFGSDLLAAATYMLPYLLWDAVKALLATALIPTAWLIVKKIKG
jgi:biotin transport system substrate-specific component